MRKILTLCFLVMTVQFLSAGQASAGWKFWRTDGDSKATSKAATQQQVVRKFHYKVTDDETEKELLTLLRSRELVTVDVAVLRRLVRAKQTQFADIQGRMKGEFGLEPALKYEYDADTMTVFEAATDKAPRKEIKKLAEKRDGEKFLNMLAMKRRLDSDIVVLQRIDKEQSENLMEVYNMLLRKYGVRHDRQYQYNRNEKILYEIVPPEAAQPTPSAAQPQSEAAPQGTAE